MSTLTTAPLAPLLKTLIAEYNETSLATDLEQIFPEEDHERMMRSKTEYPDLYGRLKNFPLAVSQETGMLLYLLARSSKAKTIVEFGTSFGLSTLFLAAALRDNGGGLLITSEFEAEKITKAQNNLIAGGLVDLVEFREGDALRTLNADLPETVDLLLLDGAKALYTEILGLVEKRLKPGALIIADDASRSEEYLPRVKDPDGGYLSISLADDVELSMRLT